MTPAFLILIVNVSLSLAFLSARFVSIMLSRCPVLLM